MNSMNGATPRAWKMIGVHQTMDNAVPAAPNPRTAQVRGGPLKTVATCRIDKAPTQSYNTSNLAGAMQCFSGSACAGVARCTVEPAVPFRLLYRHAPSEAKSAVSAPV